MAMAAYIGEGLGSLCEYGLGVRKFVFDECVFGLGHKSLNRSSSTKGWPKKKVKGLLFKLLM